MRGRRGARLGLLLVLLLAIAGPQSAEAQDGPGATIDTHHESIPNPVFGSDVRVAPSCQAPAEPCDWNDSATWLTSAVPAPDSLVIIDGHVEIRDQAAQALSIGIYPGGRLSFARDADTRLQTADLVVLDGGWLDIGTATAPVQGDYTAEVVFRDVPFDAADVQQHLRGLVVVDGKVSIHGQPLDETYLRTAIEPQAGDSTIVTAESMSAAGWRVGDTVTIPTSRQCSGPERPECASQTEDRRITAISGPTATLDTSLIYTHPGARNHDGELDFTPHLINKSRNVVFRSQNANGVRGHLLFHGRSDIDMRYAAVIDMGRTDIADLGPSNQKGRYPIHAHHLIGPRAPQPNGYQFSLVGNVVDFGAANETQDRKWGIAIHASHFGLIEGNVVDRASGAGIVTEDGSESGNVLRENFVVRVVGGNGNRLEDRDPGDGTKLGRAGVGYWFNGGGRNFFERNVAADIGECVYCYGFKFDNVRNGELVFPSSQGADPHVEGGETVAADAVGIKSFVGNEAYGVPNGMTVWWECTFGTLRPNDECSSRIDSLHVWHHHRWGYHGYPVNNLTMSNVVMRGDASVLTNRFEQTVGFEFADYMHRNLVIDNADLQNLATAINVSSLRDQRGVTGPDVGVTTIANSYLVAAKAIAVWAPASVNAPTDDLPPQTLLVNNVRFDYPAVNLGEPERGHIFMHDTSTILDDNKTEYGLRNDVWVQNYNSAPGVDGDDLYIVPDYQGPSRCDDTVGVCGSEVSANYDDIAKGHVYALRDGDDAMPVIGDVSCDGFITLRDALMITQHAGAARADAGLCPLPDPSAQLNAARADVNGNGVVDDVDAALILECIVEIPNSLCPA